REDDGVERVAIVERLVQDELPRRVDAVVEDLAADRPREEGDADRGHDRRPAQPQPRAEGIPYAHETSHCRHDSCPRTAGIGGQCYDPSSSPRIERCGRYPRLRASANVSGANAANASDCMSSSMT